MALAITTLLCVALAAPVAEAAPMVETAPRQRLGRSFWLGSGLLAAATVFDIESTYNRLGRCSATCGEGNQAQSGVIASGRGWAYGIQATLNGGVMYASARAKRSRHAVIRRVWWLPLAIVAWGHAIGGLLNSSFEN